SRTYVRIRNRVVATRVPGVAAGDAPGGQPGSTARAVERQRVEGVLRTRGVESAPRREVHAEQAPRPDRQHQDPRQDARAGRGGLGGGGAHDVVPARRTSVATAVLSSAKGMVSTDRSASKR